MLGVRIGTKHSYTDFGLRWLEPYSIGYPEPDLYTVKVPGADGLLDFTEALTGRVRFKTRTIELHFEMADSDYFTWEWRKQEIAAYLHGKKHRIFLDTDPKYYYLARLTVNSEKSSKATSSIKLTGEADPYKYWQYSSLDDWLWDPFNFEVDTVFEGRDIEINGSRDVVVPPTMSPAVPTFTAHGSLSVTFEGTTVALPDGVPLESPYIVFGPEENILHFTGTGIVDIGYTGGTL